MVRPLPVEREYRNRSRLYGTAVRAYTDPSLLLLMLEDLQLAQGLSVLDLGAGQGDASLPLRRAGAEVMAVDISREMLQAGAAKGALTPGKWRICDLSEGSLPFLDGEFDVALTRFALHDLADLGPLFSEVRRVLRPQGLFQIVDMSLPSHSGLSLYNAIHRHKSLFGPLQCWIRDVVSLRRCLAQDHFAVVREHWYESLIQSTDWVIEGQIGEKDHQRLLEKVAEAIARHPRAAAALGLTILDERFAARFPVVLLTAQRVEGER